MKDEKPSVADIEFREDGYHAYQIIQIVKVCGSIEYNRFVNTPKDELLWTTAADMDAAHAILWLEAHYKHKIDQLKQEIELLKCGQKP